MSLKYCVVADFEKVCRVYLFMTSQCQIAGNIPNARIYCAGC